MKLNDAKIELLAPVSSHEHSVFDLQDDAAASTDEISHYLNDLELGIQKGGKRTRKYRRTLDERRKNVKRFTKKRKTTRRLQKR
jgi:hypothetical protein